MFTLMTVPVHFAVALYLKTRLSVSHDTASNTDDVSQKIQVWDMMVCC